MKLTVNGREFKPALEWAGNFVKRTAWLVLASVVVEAKDGQVTLRTCDGTIFGLIRIPASIEEEGSVCVSFNSLLSAVIGEMACDMELTHNRFIVTEGSYVTKLPFMPHDEFPKMPEKPDGMVALAPEFWESVRRVSEAAATGKEAVSRPYLESVYVESGKAVATNTARMHVAEAPECLSGKVPLCAAKVALGMGEVKGLIDGDKLWLESDSALACLVAASGPFPPWERVVPQEFGTTWTVDKDQFKSALRFLSGKADADRIGLSVEGGELTVSCTRVDQGEVSAKVPCIARGHEVKWWANREYLIDALGVIDGEGVCIQITSPSRPVILSSSAGERDRFGLVAPMAGGQ